MPIPGFLYKTDSSHMETMKDKMTLQPHTRDICRSFGPDPL